MYVIKQSITEICQKAEGSHPCYKYTKFYENIPYGSKAMMSSIFAWPFISLSTCIWAQLFKANDVIKIYIEWYANMLKMFAEKMCVTFASYSYFSAKNIRILCIESAKKSMKWPLMSSLS